MPLRRRHKIYHMDDTVHHRRIRQSLGTTDWREATRREQQRIAEASKNTNAPEQQPRPTGGRPFHEIATEALAQRRVHCAEETYKMERGRLKPLLASFGHLRLEAITPEAVFNYQAQRQQKGISNRTINLEVTILRRHLRAAKLWHRFEQVRMLREHSSAGRVLSREEETRLRGLARENPNWFTAYCAMEIALYGGTRGCELKGLRWKDIDFDKQTMTITRSKSEAGERTIPLHEVAQAAIVRLFKRAIKLGGAGHDHYCFPSCESRKFDFARPMKGWRSAWRSLISRYEVTRSCPGCDATLHRVLAMCPFCGRDLRGIPDPPPLKGLRFHDMRHTVVTRLLEAGVTLAVVGQLMGWSASATVRMARRYGHIRLAATRQAIDKLEAPKPTKPPEEEPQDLVVAIQ